jgi:hypothetical protein
MFAIHFRMRHEASQVPSRAMFDVRQNNMSKAKNRLISITEKYWGSKFPHSLSDLTCALLPLNAIERYSFTGVQCLDLKANEVLVFRYARWLLGEAKFMKWVDGDPYRMIYLRWTPKVGQDGSLTQSQKNDPHVEETSSAQS